MSSILFPNIPTCKKCGHLLAPEELACEQCHTLVHADLLESYAAQARAMEEQHNLREALRLWMNTLELLPPESKQAEWVRNHGRELRQAVNAAEATATQKKWVARLGPLAPLAVALAKGKALLALFKLNFLLSLVAFMGVYWSLYGPKFGIGFSILILIHELGHFIDIKRRGLPAEMPVFLPGLGAYVRWDAIGVSMETRAAVSLAGPLAGWISAAACALIWLKTGIPIWAALARAGAWLNVLNLIPVWMLDGGQAVRAMNKVERIVLLTTALALCLLLGENVLILVAGGAAYTLFAKDMPSGGSRVTTLYFLAVLASLALVMWMLPGQGFGKL